MSLAYSRTRRHYSNPNTPSIPGLELAQQVRFIQKLVDDTTRTCHCVGRGGRASAMGRASISAAQSPVERRFQRRRCAEAGVHSPKHGDGGVGERERRKRRGCGGVFCLFLSVYPVFGPFPCNCCCYSSVDLIIAGCPTRFKQI